MPRKKQKSATPDRPFGAYVEFGADHLRDRLSLFKHILVKRASRNDLQSYHFTVRADGSAMVAGRDMDHRLQLKLKVLNRTGTGTIMIDHEALNALLGGYVEPRVRLHLDDPQEIKVEGLQTKLTVPGYDPEKELKLTAEGSLTRSGWLFRGDELAEALRRTRFAADLTDSGRYALSGIAITLPEEGQDRAEVVATDGGRLAIYRVPVKPFGVDPARVWRPEKRDVVTPLPFPPLIPNKVVPVALRLAKEAGPDAVGIAVIPGDVLDLKRESYGPGTIQLVTRDAVLTAKIPEGRYPGYRDARPTTEVVAELRLDDARKLGDLLATAVAATDSETKLVELVLAGGCLMMTVVSETRGKAVLSLLVPHSQGRTTVDLNALKLRQFIDAAGGDPLQVRFHGPKQAVVLQAGPHHEYVIMPMGSDRPRPARPEPEPAPAPDLADEGEPEGEGDDEGGNDGGNVAAPDPEPTPVKPVAATTDAHVGNGKAKSSKRSH